MINFNWYYYDTSKHETVRIENNNNNNNTYYFSWKQVIQYINNKINNKKHICKNNK